MKKKRDYSAFYEANERAYNAMEHVVWLMHRKISPKERMDIVRSRFPSAARALEAPDYILRDCGFSRIDAIFFTTIMPLARVYKLEKHKEYKRLNTLSLMANYLSGIFVGRSVECFYLVCLTKTGKVIDTILMQTGDHDSAPFYFTDMLRMAFQRGAKALVLCHNHPRGTLRPSREDLLCTLQMLLTVPLTGILVLDHIIVAKGRAVSIRETGLLPSFLWTFQDQMSPLSRKWMDTELLVE